MRSDQLVVTLVQQDLHWESIEANLAHFEEVLWSHDIKGDLIVLPEMFSTGFTMNAREMAEPMNSKTFRWMKQQAAQHEAVVCGSYIIQESGICYNRFFAVYPEGKYVTYDKKHLFALAGEHKPFVSGNDRVIYEVKGWKILPMICYDLRFPVWARQQMLNDFEYDVLMYVANWPAPRILAWDTLLKARAIENLSFSLGVNRIGKDGTQKDYVGHSNAYDFLGKGLLDIEEGPFIRTVTLDGLALDDYREKYPFQKEADQFKIV